GQSHLAGAPIVSPMTEATGATEPRARSFGAGRHLAWFAGVSLLAFLLPFLLTSVWGLQHDVYYLIYFAATLASLVSYAQWAGFDLRERLRSRWRSSLALGLAATAFV